MTKKDTKTKVSKSDALVNDIKAALLDAGNINNNPDWEGWSTMLKTVREADIANPSTALEMMKEVDTMVQDRLKEYMNTHVKAAIVTVAAEQAEETAKRDAAHTEAMLKMDVAKDKLDKERKELEFKFKRAHKEALLDKDDVIGDLQEEVEELREDLADSAKTILKDVLDDISKSTGCDDYYLAVRKEGKWNLTGDYIINDRELAATFKKLAKQKGHI